MIRLSMRKLFRDERATAIIELALVAPIVALTVVGIADLSNAFSRKLGLEQGAQRAIEKIMQTTEDSTVENTLAAEAVCQVNGTDSAGVCKTSPITTSDVTVTFRADCTTTSTNAVTTRTTTDSGTYDTWTTAGCPVGSTLSTYISITVLDKYTPMFPLHFSALDSDGTYHLSATAGMRTS